MGQASGAPWDGTSPLFGTTFFGGSYDNGIAYKLEYNSMKWIETVLHNFKTSIGPNELAMDSSGNLFGSTVYGGKHGDSQSGGVLFKLAHGTWQETILHNFCAQTNCADGEYPTGRLAIDASGNLFGVTNGGGSHGNGVAFEYTAGGIYKVLWDFTDMPFNAGLLMDGSGHLFGTTSGGCTTGCGAGSVFELSRLKNGSWGLATLHSFCSEPNCVDGEQPEAPVAMDGLGNLYGTTSHGGTSDTDDGVLFKLTR